LSNTRVAVIGLDGMPWHILNRLFEQDAMPNLEGIIKKSLRGILNSTIPPFTPPAWTSIATGVNPGKHRIFDFLVFSNNYNARLASSHDVRYPRIHEMLALRGLETICINQPFTYPIFKAKNMVVISDWIAPKLCYFPDSMSQYLQSYRSNTPAQKFVKHPEIAISESLERISVVNQLMEELNWDLFWVIYTEPDHIFHGYYSKILKGENPFLKVFREIDRTIETALRKTDMILIVSDHGFSEYKYTVNINTILYELGLISTTRERTTMHISDFAADHTTNVESVKLPLRIHKFLLDHPFLKSMVKKLYKKFTGRDITAKKPDVDIANSKAFLLSSSSYGIYVKEQSLVRFIIDELKRNESINRVYRREEIFHGPYVHEAPHILVEPNFDKGFIIAGTAKIAPKAISSGNVYNHHPNGILIMFGHGIPAVQLKQPVRTEDIVPTILRYMALPLPVDTDGKPLPNIDYPKKEIKHHDYSRHWRLIRQIQMKKSKLRIG